MEGRRWRKRGMGVGSVYLGKKLGRVGGRGG